MEFFNLIDIIAALILGASTLWGFFRGLAQEVMDVATWIISAVLAYMFKDQLVPYLSQFLGADFFAQLAAFFLLFIVLLILISLVTSPLARIVKIKSLITINRLFGFVYGCIRGFLILSLFWIVGIVFIQPSLENPLMKTRAAPYLQASSWMLYNLVLTGSDTAGLSQNETVDTFLEASRDALTEADIILKRGFRLREDQIAPSPA